MLLGTFKDIHDFVNMFINFNNDIKGILLNLLISILYGLNYVLLEKYISLENVVYNTVNGHLNNLIGSLKTLGK